MIKKNRIFSLNYLSRLIFLLITPVFFQYFALGFIWHSIYWGVITFVFAIWLVFILISPFFGRIGCGWFCFMGTVQDFAGKYAFRQQGRKKTLVWLRISAILGMFGSAFIFYFLNKGKGITHNFSIDFGFLPLLFDNHYKLVWGIDVCLAMVIALLLNKRWACKNMCPIGALCAVGSKHSRLLAVVSTDKCTYCRKCEKECLNNIPIVEYVKNNEGLIMDSECIMCGKCMATCKFDAINYKFIWNRKKYIVNHRK